MTRLAVSTGSQLNLEATHVEATPTQKDEGTTPNAAPRYEVSRADLPLHCPLPGMSTWNSHPRVYLPVKAQGRATCPYCGAEFILKD